MYECLEKKDASMVYIQTIKDMHKGEKARVRTLTGDVKDFLIDIGLHQGLALNTFLFALVMTS